MCDTRPEYLQQLETVCMRHANIYEGSSGLMIANLWKVEKSFFILQFMVLSAKQNDISQPEKKGREA